MKSKTIVALLLAGSMSLGLCACAGSDPTDTTAANPAAQNTTEAAAKAQVMTCGDWTVEVPAGYELKIGDFLDENDTRYFSVRKSSFSYMDFSADGEERVMNKYNYNKDTYTNEQKDVSGSFGGHEWVGFQYSTGVGCGVEAYTTINGEMIRVASAGYAFDDATFAAVLSSLQYTPSAKTEPDTEPVTTEAEAETESAAQPETTDAPETEAPETTEYEPSEGAPVYAKTVELKDVTVGIQEGYTEVKDGAPYQYVMTNDATGGTVFIQNMAGNAADSVKGVMDGLDYETREMDLNGMHWTVATTDTIWCFASDTDMNGDVLTFTVSYGCTEEEMEDLIFGVMPRYED